VLVRRTAVALCALAAALTATPARAGDLVQASLLAEPAAIAPGATFTAAVRLQVPPGWHVYFKNPGDSGLAPKLRWELGSALTAGPIQWPTPRRYSQGPLTDFAYEGDVWLLVELTAAKGLAPGPGDAARLSVDAEWLVCQETCIPEKAALQKSVPVVASAALVKPGPDAPAFAAARERLPRQVGWSASVGSLVGTKVEGASDRAVELRVTTGALPLPGGEAFFYPDDEGVIAPSAPQVFTPTADGFVLALVLDKKLRAPPERLSGIVVVRGQTEADEVSALLSTAPAAALRTEAPVAAWLAVVFAFLGGLLLNLMPCVLPVLGFKVLGFVRQAQGDAGLARTHGLVFAAGVVVSFWVLALALFALNSSGAQLGWGFQLQSPAVVTLLSFLFFGLGLSFLGFTDLNGFGGVLQEAAGAAHQSLRRYSDGLAGSFGSGVLATAVATPCTAPFMGTALGAALVLPRPIGFAIFTALGVGMALPYVVLASWPALLRSVPRPGPWMVVLQQALAFPLFATVVWLLSVLSVQTGQDRVLLALAGLTTLGFCLWLLRVTGGPEAPALRRRAGMVVSAALLLIAVLVNSGGSRGPEAPRAGDREPGAVAWVDWSEERLASLRGEGRTVFVDFTAAWCLTCQVNERVVFSSPLVRERFARLGVVPMRADWTRSDPAITRALAAFGRSGVPLNVLHGPGGQQVLPSVLTPAAVLEALERVR
jgi:thiol:disulfide interchange protein DsbD